MLATCGRVCQIGNANAKRMHEKLLRKTVGTGGLRKNKSRILFFSPKFRISLTHKNFRKVGENALGPCDIGGNYPDETDLLFPPPKIKTGLRNFILCALIPSAHAPP